MTHSLTMKASALLCGGAVHILIFLLLQTAAAGAGGRRQDQGGGGNNCTWHAQSATLECLLGLQEDSSSSSEAFFSEVPLTSVLRQARQLRLHCQSSSAPSPRRSLRDILDVSFERLSRSQSSQSSSSSSSSWQQRLRSLQLINCPLHRLERLDLLYIDSSITTDLEELTISGQGDGAKKLKIEQDSFQDGPRSLETLDLSGSGLSSLLAKVLCPLGTSLQKLNLSSNAVFDVYALGLANQSLAGNAAFDDEGHCPLGALAHLDLSANGLQRLPGEAFVLATNLKEIDVSRNALEAIDAGAFNGLHGLKVLSLAHNNIPELPVALLEAKNGLRELYLNNNSLANLPPGLLERLSSLVVLNLSQNALTNKALGSHPFSALLSLVALDLSHNKLTALSHDLLLGLSSLQVLTVAHNQLHSVAVGAFSGLPALHALVISHNEVESLSPKVFDGLEKLNSLAIDHNRIKGLNRDLFRNCCSSLQDLSLHSNDLRHIPHPALKSLPLLRTLDLGENQISEVHPNALADMKELYGLRLAGNQLKKLTEGVFAQAEDIKMLNLADNQIEKIDQDVFRPLKKLKALRLDNNRLDDINGLLTTQHHLQWLNVSNNALAWFDYAFIPKALLWLNLRGNAIEELGNYYDMQTGFSLVHLDVSRNRLTRLDRQSFVHSLREVRLEENLISELAPSTFTGLANITSVNLTGNSLEKFPINSLAVTRAAGATEKQPQEPASFQLGSNPLQCDCEMEWMQRINQLATKAPSDFPLISDWTSLTCSLNNRQDSATNTSLPDIALVVPLHEVQPSEFICEYQTHCFALCMCCEFFACDCRMKCSEGCDCFHDQTWSANIIQCGLRGHGAVPDFIPMDATSIYLDGNNLTDLSTETFIGRKHLTSLYLNSSGIVELSNKTLNGLSELLVLHLDHNRITELRGGEFVDLESLRELHLNHNELSYIHSNTFSMLDALEVLILDHNRLTNFPIWQLFDNQALSLLQLSSNLWSCECAYLENVQPFLRDRRALIKDIGRMECVDHERSHAPSMTAGLNVTCGDDVMAVSFRTIGGSVGDGSAAHAVPGSPDGGTAEVLNRLIPLVAIVSAACVIVLSLIIMAVAFRKPVSVWIHSKYGVRLLNPPSSNSALASARQFDAFLHYTLTDSVFLQQNLMPQLETPDKKSYKIALRHRDLNSLQGRTLSEAFDHAVENSARVILLASTDYLVSDVCRSELSVLVEKLNIRKRGCNIIVIALNGDKKRIRQVVGTDCSIIRWNDPSFWQKLRYQLPEPSGAPHLLPQGITLGGGLGGDASKTLGGGVQPQFRSEYEDDMWTYVKGINGGVGGRSSGSSGSGQGNGQNSSLSTRSTTDNSNATLPLSSASPTASAMVLPQQQPSRQPLPPAGAAATLQHNKSANLIVNPLQGSGGHTTSRGFQQRRGGSARQQQELDFTQFRPHDLNHQHQHSDSDYMSVSDSLNRNHGSRLYQEPIYHTLEPENLAEVNFPATTSTQQRNSVSRGARPPKSGKVPGKSDSTVYINADLEVVYPKRPPPGGKLPLKPQQAQFHEDLEDYVDEDDELLAQQEDTTEEDDGLFDLSRSRNGSYVPSPAPGSFPRQQQQQQHPSARRPLPMQRKQQLQHQQPSQNNQSAYYI